MFINYNINTFSYRFNQWKRYIVGRFIKIYKNLNNYQDIIKEVKKHGEINLLVWSARQDYNIPKIPEVNIISVEDGFIRSVGLGAEYHIPISLVFDSRGIYFDATRESDLEYVLNNFDLIHEEIINDAYKIINLLRLYRINKYNLSENEWYCKTNKKVIVVPGQVERDKSIKYGSPIIKNNIELLKAVRIQEPDSYIVFKIHPDVYKNCRINQTTTRQYYEYVDEVVENCSTFSLIKHADEIHTLTSLFGFEALLEGKKVVCYGQPFYSGWGLTKDIYPLNRRRKKLTLEQLIYVTYCLYPMYVSIFTGQKITVSEAIKEIVKIKQQKSEFRYKTPLSIRLASFILNTAKKSLVSVRRRFVGGRIERV